MDEGEGSEAVKPLEWVGDSWEALVAFPVVVRKALGYALYLAQIGEKATAAKSLKGFGGTGVVEVIKDHDGNTFRAIYTVRFKDAVYLLHVFQKKSKRGSKTPPRDVSLIRHRLKLAATHFKNHYKESP